MPNTTLSAPPHEISPRKQDGLRLSTHLYLAIGVALVISILVASYMQASAGLDALKQFGVMNQRADHLDRLYQQMVEAQSSVRGYALTRNPIYLYNYRAIVPEIHDSLAVIQEDQRESLRSSATDLVRFARDLAGRLETTVRQLESGGELDKSLFEQGNVAMDVYRHQHLQLKVELLNRNLKNVQNSVRGFENARVSAVVFAIASFLFLALVVSQKQKKEELREKIQRMLQMENERLESEVRTRTEELTNLATYLTKVREKEKLDLAREMHDELGALLTAAKLDADWIERKLPPDAQALVAQRLARLRQSLTSGITLKRRITNNLRPALLYDLGLIEALKALIEEFRQGEEITVEADLPEAEPDLPEDVSLSLFRIVQEAFTNIRKYAHARHVGVALRITPETIELSVKDDGVGFDPGSPKIARHGLAGIKHRVFTHGGQLDIRTAPGSGVTITAVLPA